MDEEPEEYGDPGVPTDLMLLHLELEDTSITPEEFGQVFGGGDDIDSN